MAITPASWLFFRLRLLTRPVLRNRSATFQCALSIIKYALVIFTGLRILRPIIAPSYTQLPPHYRALRQKCTDPSSGCASPINEKIFTTAILHNPTGQLGDGRWGERVSGLVNLLGPDNAFLSIYESNSGSEGEAALNSFRARVPCPHRIVSDRHLHLSGIPNVTLPGGTRHTKHIAYLAELRNRALCPFDFSAPTTPIFDEVLFLNDIAFSPLDAVHLLFNTNQPHGGHLAACAVDFFAPHRPYDVYALRDAAGYAAYQTLFPFFPRRPGGSPSRAAILAQGDAVPVRACWGGMMAFRAEYVHNLSPILPFPVWRDVGAHKIDPARPRNVTGPVRFRHEPGVFYDACECCLFAADLQAAARRAGAEERECL